MTKTTPDPIALLARSHRPGIERPDARRTSQSAGPRRPTPSPPPDLVGGGLTPSPITDPDVPVESGAESIPPQSPDVATITADPTPPESADAPFRELAEQIRAGHERAVRSLLEDARDVGALLNRAKVLVGHGHFLPWVEEHCGFSETTARNYMRVADHWERLRVVLEANRQRAADLSLRGALALLAGPRVARPPRPNAVTVGTGDGRKGAPAESTPGECPPPQAGPAGPGVAEDPGSDTSAIEAGEPPPWRGAPARPLDRERVKQLFREAAARRLAARREPDAGRPDAPPPAEASVEGSVEPPVPAAPPPLAGPTPAATTARFWKGVHDPAEAAELNGLRGPLQGGVAALGAAFPARPRDPDRGRRLWWAAGPYRKALAALLMRTDPPALAECEACFGDGLDQAGGPCAACHGLGMAEAEG